MNTLSTELFEELWNRYNSKIYSYFRRQFDEHTAEDLCQQTYLNAWQYISTYQSCNIRKNKSWLFTIAKNVKNDYLRHVKLHRMNYNYSDLCETDIPVEHNLDDSINVQKSLQKLNEEERQLLAMAQYLTSREIGSVLGISASAVRSRIQKAKRNLQNHLDKFDIKV